MQIYLKLVLSGADTHSPIGVTTTELQEVASHVGLYQKSVKQNNSTGTKQLEEAVTWLALQTMELEKEL